MSKSNQHENEYLKLIFNNVAISKIGDATGLRATSVDGSLFVSLHSADPGEGGGQTTNEATYTSYARIAVARTTGGWTVTDNKAENAATVTFPLATGGSDTITHIGIGTDLSGASGKLLFSGELATPLVVVSGTTPVFNAGQINIVED